MSTLTPLAQRLAQAAWIEMRGPAWSNWDYAELDTTVAESARMACKARVGRTVVAVLRELADEHTSRDGNWIALPPPMLIQLADSIEKGQVT